MQGGQQGVVLGSTHGSTRQQVSWWCSWHGQPKTSKSRHLLHMVSSQLGQVVVLVKVRLGDPWLVLANEVEALVLVPKMHGGPFGAPAYSCALKVTCSVACAM